MFHRLNPANQAGFFYVKMGKFGTKKFGNGILPREFKKSRPWRLCKKKFNVLVPAPPYCIEHTTLFSISIGGYGN
jgi:hypothetical protein